MTGAANTSCEFCRQQIKLGAKICRYCNRVQSPYILEMYEIGKALLAQKREAERELTQTN